MAIYKDSSPTKDGRTWYFSTYYVDLDGINKKKKSKKYELKKDAQEAERIFLLTYKEQSSNNMTFEDLILDYIRHQKEKIKITTYRKLPPFINRMESFKHIKLKDFNINHFNLWKSKINKEKISTTYKNNIYKFLKSLIYYAINYHNFNNLTMVLNKMSGFNNPNELKKEMLFYTYNEFMQYIDEEIDLKYKSFFKTLYYCGLRKGEANALTWKDIDFKKKLLSVNKSINQKIKGQSFVLLPPKTKSSTRILPIPNSIINDLKTLKEQQKKYINYSDEWFIFGGIKPLADTTIQIHNINNAKKINKRIRIHDFRHSCASLLISKGASISLVAKYLGHSNIAVTLNTYTHLFKNELEDIIKIINNLEK